MNRRQMLFGSVFAATLTGAFSVDARRFGGVGSAVTFPLVAPSGAWTGTAGSGFGGSPPVNPTRTTGKPAMQWLDVSGQAWTTNQPIGADTGELAGIAKVTFSVEGTNQDVTTPSVYLDTDASDNPRARFGYFITLNTVAAYTAHAAGAVQVYATAVPVNGALQNQVIGPFTVYPRALTFTDPTNGWYKTLGMAGSGADYTDLVTAQYAFHTSGKLYPRLKVISSGTYDMGTPYSIRKGGGGFDAWQPSEETNNTGNGFFELVHAPGVSATFRMGGAAGVFNPLGNVPVAAADGFPYTWNLPWFWWTCVTNLCIRGSGITIDWLSTQAICTWNGGDGAIWFDGCQHTNSIGTRDSVYWNGNRHVGLQTLQPQGVGGIAAHYTDCTIRYLDTAGVAMLFQRNAVLDPSMGRFNGTASGFGCNLIGNYIRGVNPIWFITGQDILSVTYGGAGTTATVSGDGANNLILKVDGSATTIPLSLTYGSGNYWPQDVVNAINGVGGGWSATLLDNTWQAAIINSANAFAGINCFHTAATLKASIDIHSEITLANPATDYNYLARGNVFRECYYATAFFNHVPNDSFIYSNVFHQDPVNRSLDSSQFCASHVVFQNNFLDGSYKNAGGDCDVYSSAVNNIMNGGADSGVLPWVNNLFPNVTLPTGTGTSGNVALASTAALLACFTDLTSGDYRPAGASLTNLRSYSAPNYDGRLASRAASDAPGPWKIGGTAPVWPF